MGAKSLRSEKVAATAERCLDGRTDYHYQPGHPHGFHEHIYAGEVHHCRVLHDPEGLLRGLKAAVAACPPETEVCVLSSV